MVDFCASIDWAPVYPVKVFFIRCDGHGLVDRSLLRPIVSRTMTIRFQCGSCSQPIEIDDEWASKLVACPYCRKTVTAPIESTLGDPATIQTAVPVAASPTAAASFPASAGMGPTTNKKNTIAVVALCLAISAYVMYFAAWSVAAAHPEKVQEIQNAAKGVTTFAEQSKITSDLLAAHPDVVGWMIILSLLSMGGMAANLAAIVCAIIAVRRPVRRGIAVAALAIGFVPVLLFL